MRESFGLRGGGSVVAGATFGSAALAQGIRTTVDPTTNAKTQLGLGSPVLVTNLLITVVFWVLGAAAVALTGYGILRAVQSLGEEERLATAKKIILAGVVAMAVVVGSYLTLYFAVG